MTGKTVEAQQLTIYILRTLDKFERKRIYGKARKSLNGNQPAQEQLELCLIMANELVETPDRYASLDAVAKTIVARKKNQDPEKVKIQEYRNEMGIQSNKILCRIREGKRSVRSDEIDGLCDGFTNNSNHLFWVNQMYALFPYLRMEDTIGGPILHCLRAIWDCLGNDQKDSILKELPQYVHWKKKLEPSSKNRLYDLLLDAQAKTKAAKGSGNATIEDLCWQLSMETETWSKYKEAWEDYEKSGGIAGYPELQYLSKDRLMYLAIVLDMDYAAAVELLASGGFSLHLTEQDEKVMRYLLNRSTAKKEDTEEDILNLLHYCDRKTGSHSLEKLL